MTYLIVAGLGVVVGYMLRSIDSSRHRLADDVAFIRSLPEPPSNVTVVDDERVPARAQPGQAARGLPADQRGGEGVSEHGKGPYLSIRQKTA